MKKVIWADYFPQMPSKATDDPRIFETEWKKVAQGNFVVDGTKHKKVFACVVGGDCYGVDVWRELAYDAKAEIKVARDKVAKACDYYEEHETWPKDNDLPTKNEAS